MSSVAAHKSGHMTESPGRGENMFGMHHEGNGASQGVLWRRIILISVEISVEWPFKAILGLEVRKCLENYSRNPDKKHLGLTLLVALMCENLLDIIRKFIYICLPLYLSLMISWHQLSTREYKWTLKEGRRVPTISIVESRPNYSPLMTVSLTEYWTGRTKSLS